MKVLTITGTRPELIRLSIILRKLDEVCEHIHAYTNQNSDPNLSTLFFEDLKIRKPNWALQHKTPDDFLWSSFMTMGKILREERPDKVLVLGDTNSGLMSIVAAKMGYPVYHMEAGNRCFDENVPEELNRKIIDVCSHINLPYTENSKQNLINEGHHKNKVFKIGNPIKEVLDYHRIDILSSDILKTLKLVTVSKMITPYALLSLHRSENVDDIHTAREVMAAMAKVAKQIPVIFPIHPRTKDRFEKNGIEIPNNVICIDPVGFFDFVKLEQEAKVIFTDSGTIPEEATIFGKPCIVLRNTTERQELMECGSMVLAGTKRDNILNAFFNMDKMKQYWTIPNDYEKVNVSDTVIRILLGK